MDVPALAAYIHANPGVAPQQVADAFGVSVRTVRTYVHQANTALEGFARIELARKSGYRLVVDDADRWSSWNRQQKAPGGGCPQSPETRAAYLLNDLLMRTDWITIDDVCSILYISRSTATSDLKNVERLIEPFGLKLEKRPHYGVRVTGSEMARRLCLANNIIDAADEQARLSGCDTETELDELLSMTDAVDAASDDSGRAESDKQASAEAKHPAQSRLLGIITDCVNEVVRDEDLTVNPAAYQNLLVHIAVALIRIKRHCYMPMASDHLERIKATREYRLAAKIASLVAERTGTELPEEEIGYIAIHLAGKQTILDASPAGEDGRVVISDEVWSLVADMIECVWRAYRFDFRGDLELRMNLATHIVPLAVRLKYGMHLKNPLIEDIKLRYPLAFSMALDSSSVLAETYGAQVSEDEAGYLALSFALALERQKNAATKKNILVVCASGAGSARLLEYRCRREFGEYVGKVSTCDVLGIDSIDFSDIDYVFTTVPIERTLPVPVCEVSYFLDAADVADARELLSGEASFAGVPAFFASDLFFPHMKQRTKQEVLDFLLDRACEQGGVAGNFRELVWKREGVVPTAFGNRVAMPHPLEVASKRTFICVGLLDEPVVWDTDGDEVQAVFLSVFAPEASDSLHTFIESLAEVLMNKRAIDLLIERQDWQTLSDVMQGEFARARVHDGSSELSGSKSSAGNEGPASSG